MGTAISNKEKILKIFSKNPDAELHMREIGRILKKEPGVFQRAINALVKEGILLSEYRANARFFSLNKKNKTSHRKTSAFQAELQTLVNSTTDRICSRDREGALLAWNKAFADSIKKLFGVEPYVGLKTVELISPDNMKDLARVQETFRRVFSGETVTVRYKYKMPDGEWHCMESSWVPLWKEDEVYAVGEVTRDITAKKGCPERCAEHQ